MKSMMRVKKRPSKPTLIIGAIVALLLVVIAVLGWKYYELKKDPSADAKAEISRVVKLVGAIFELPTDEEPTVAKIKDKNQLSNQQFYSKAANGDYVLVYGKNKIALIYREKTNKLINVGPVNFVDNDQKPGKPMVAVLNGSGGSEKLNTAVNKLNELSEQLTLTANQSNAKTTIEETIVVDISGQNSALANTLAEKLGGSVQTSLPSGETAPSGASIVVIVGKG